MRRAVQRQRDGRQAGHHRREVQLIEIGIEVAPRHPEIADVDDEPEAAAGKEQWRVGGGVERAGGRAGRVHAADLDRRQRRTHGQPRVAEFGERADLPRFHRAQLGGQAADAFLQFLLLAAHGAQFFAQPSGVETGGGEGGKLAVEVAVEAGQGLNAIFDQLLFGGALCGALAAHQRRQAGHRTGQPRLLGGDLLRAFLPFLRQSRRKRLEAGQRVLHIGLPAPDGLGLVLDPGLGLCETA
jgi:hypothetical protein